MRNANGAEIRKMRALAEKRNERLDGGGFWRTLDLALTLFAVVVFALAVRGAIIEPVRVEGSSMFDTLENGDYMFVEKLTYAFSAPQKGDIVICYYPDEYYETFQKAYRTRVKRVVAVAGDTVQTVDGALYVNGVCAEEPSRMTSWQDRATCVLFGHAAERRSAGARRQPDQFQRQPQSARRADPA